MFETCQAWLASSEQKAVHIDPARSISKAACTFQNITLFHAFWHGPFKRPTALSVLSFLATQPLQCTRLVVWYEGEDIFNEYTDKLLDLVHGIDGEAGRRFNTSSNTIYDMQYSVEFHELSTLANYAPRDDVLYDFFAKKHSSPHMLKIARADSDDVRFMVLYLFGGLYVDLDVLLLRDMTDLLPYEFAEWWSMRWSVNTAILRFHRNSTLLWQLVSRALEDKDIPGVSIFHPQRILNYAVERGVDDQFLVYPATFFDPAWRFVPTPQGYEEISKARGILKAHDFFEASGCYHDGMKGTCFLKDFYPGSFAFHWHNQWDKQPHPGSFFAMFEDLYQGLAGDALQRLAAYSRLTT